MMFVQIEKKNPRSSSSLEIFDNNCHIYYLGVRDRKMEI